MIFNSLTVRFEKGINVIKGENGSGKTTLLNLISKRIKHKTINHNMKMSVFFDFKLNNIFIKSFDYLYELVSIDFKSKINNVMIDLNIPNCRINFLSKGNKTKLNLLITLFSNFDLLILDEPFDGLDIKSVNYFKKYIIKNLEDKIIIIVDHSNNLDKNAVNIFEIEELKLCEK
ncbi:MAG: ATP-binding cassette domain-containing protein [Anaeroplasmataceae bacterium]